MLEKIDIPALRVKNKNDLARVAGLIIPGGESTVISKLLAEAGLDAAIRSRALGGAFALWGTCAGAILMAKRVTGNPPKTLGLMDITIERNAYGSQMNSFETDIAAGPLGKKPLHAIFIRAPRIRKIGGDRGARKNMEVLATLGRNPVAVRQNNLLATMFHPELTEDTRMHEYFIAMTLQHVSRD